MTQASQNTDLKASTKQYKIHRTPHEISRKIIAFEEIVRADFKKSTREVTKLLHIPNSTMQTWQEQKTKITASDDEVAVFFATPTGSALLSRIVMAVMYNNKCGASRIRGVQECLFHAGLDKYVATSAGALQKFWKRCEDSILAFGKHWKKLWQKK